MPSWLEKRRDHSPAALTTASAVSTSSAPSSPLTTTSKPPSAEPAAAPSLRTDCTSALKRNCAPSALAYREIAVVSIVGSTSPSLGVKTPHSMPLTSTSGWSAAISSGPSIVVGSAGSSYSFAIAMFCFASSSRSWSPFSISRMDPVRCSPTPPSSASCIDVIRSSARTCTFLILGEPPKRVTRPAACHVAPAQSWPAFSSTR